MLIRIQYHDILFLQDKRVPPCPFLFTVISRVGLIVYVFPSGLLTRTCQQLCPSREGTLRRSVPWSSTFLQRPEGSLYIWTSISAPLSMIMYPFTLSSGGVDRDGISIAMARSSAHRFNHPLIRKQGEGHTEEYFPTSLRGYLCICVGWWTEMREASHEGWRMIIKILQDALLHWLCQRKNINIIDLFRSKVFLISISTSHGWILYISLRRQNAFLRIVPFASCCSISITWSCGSNLW